MRKYGKDTFGGSGQFFGLIIGGDTQLYAYYKLNFFLIHNHKYSLEELENMLPFERDMYLTLFELQLEEDNKKIGVNGERGYI